MGKEESVAWQVLASSYTFRCCPCRSLLDVFSKSPATQFYLKLIVTIFFAGTSNSILPSVRSSTSASSSARLHRCACR